MALQRAAVLALVVLFCAGARATEVSFPKKLTGRLSCILPVQKLTCIRDWRSGFVAGVRFGFDGVNGWQNVCSQGLFNQSSWEMSTPSAIDSMNNVAPEWIKTDNPSPYLYPFNSPITQVIVLQAKNPWGDSWGNIPAILFGYLKTDGKLDFAVCGNAQYAQFYLNPADSDPPPTPVQLKTVYTSPLTDDGDLTALGSFNGICSNRGGYLGGDPWQSSKFHIKKLTQVCFTKYDDIKLFTPNPSDPPKRIEGDFDCGDDDDKDERCFRPCHYDKKHAKKSTSFSCAMHGTAIATGKYGAIVFDKDGYQYDWEMDDEGNYQQVLYKGGEEGLSKGLEPEEEVVSEDESSGKAAPISKEQIAAAIKAGQQAATKPAKS